MSLVPSLRQKVLAVSNTTLFFPTSSVFIITFLTFCLALFQIGMGYSLGIVLALTVAAASSGGHFNPGITITNAVFGRFPWRKVPQYVVFIPCIPFKLNLTGYEGISSHKSLVLMLLV